MVCAGSVTKFWPGRSPPTGADVVAEESGRESKRLEETVGDQTREYRDIPVADIIVTRENPRHIDKHSAGWGEFVGSVAAQGVRVPVLVRPHPKKEGKYELRAGERRVRAAKQARQETVPAVVFPEADDQEAFELTYIENAEREDLTPLEEGEAVARLLDHYQGDAKAVAATLGRSEKWVRLRARIRELIPGWRELIAEPGESEAVAYFGVGHVALIARLPEGTQAALLEQFSGRHGYYFSRMSVARLQREIEQRYLSLLRSAPWKLEDEELLPAAGACSACPKRSSYQGALFADLAGKSEQKDDRCLDRSCWQTKLGAYLDVKLASAREKYPELLLVANDHLSIDQEDQLEKRYGSILKRYDYDSARSKAEKGAQPALVVAGPGAGSVRWVKVRSRSMGRGRPSGPTPLSVRRERLESKRTSAILTAVKGHLVDTGVEAVLDDNGDDSLLLALAAVLGGAETNTTVIEGQWERIRSLLEKPFDTLAILWSNQIRPVLYRRLTTHHGVTQTPLHLRGEAKSVCEIIGLDFVSIEKQAQADHPEPKSWAGLNEDGTRRPAKKAQTAKEAPAKKDNG